MKTALAIFLFSLMVTGLILSLGLIYVMLNPCAEGSESDEELIDATPYPEEEIHR